MNAVGENVGNKQTKNLLKNLMITVIRRDEGKENIRGVD
jgi:hypothetical protein